MIKFRILEGKAKRYVLAFALLLVLIVLFRSWYSNTLPLAGDEAYHWEWSRPGHLAFGYYDHPPLTAYMIRLSTGLFGGGSEFSVRLPANIMLAALAVVSFMFASRIVSRRGLGEVAAMRAGFFAGLLVLVTPMFAFFSMYMSTDPPLIFFWGLTIYLAYIALDSGRWGSWILAGLAFGFALMSKFLALFLVPALGLFVLLSKRDRKWLARPQPYVALLCAVIVASPMLWWNARNGWATFVFNFALRHKEQSFSWWHPFGYFAGPLLFLSPGVVVMAVAGIWRGLRDWRKHDDRPAFYLSVSLAVPLIYFGVVSFVRSVGAHWLTGAWFAALVYIPCRWETMASEGKKTRCALSRRWVIGMALAITLFMHLVVYLAPRLLSMKWAYAGDPSRISTEKISELYGWDELGEEVEREYREMLGTQGDSPAGLFLICDQYGLAANVSFYSPSKLRTHLWCRKRRHGENYRFWDDFESLEGQDAIFVTKASGRRLQSRIESLDEYFGKVQDPPGLFVVEEKGVPIRAFSVIKCYDFDGRIPEL